MLRNHFFAISNVKIKMSSTMTTLLRTKSHTILKNVLRRKGQNKRLDFYITWTLRFDKSLPAFKFWVKFQFGFFLSRVRNLSSAFRYRMLNAKDNHCNKTLQNLHANHFFVRIMAVFSVSVKKCILCILLSVFIV